MGLFGKRRRTTGEITTTTLITSGCHIAGELSLAGHIQIDGVIEGKINTPQTLIVSNEGRVKGEVRADKLTVSGLIEGDCYANTVRILAKGQIVGRVFSDNFIIDIDGCFQGETRLSIKSQVIEHDNPNVETLTSA